MYPADTFDSRLRRRPGTTGSSLTKNFEMWANPVITVLSFLYLFRSLFHLTQKKKKSEDQCEQSYNNVGPPFYPWQLNLVSHATPLSLDLGISLTVKLSLLHSLEVVSFQKADDGGFDFWNVKFTMKSATSHDVQVACAFCKKKKKNKKTK